MRSQLTLAPLPSSVPVARAWVTDTLGIWEDDAQVEAARLVVSELVGNVIRHAPTDLQVSVSLDATRLRVAVSDGDAARVERRERPAGPWEDGGRGLALVERVSDRWGIDYTDSGKTVWAEWSREDPGSCT